LTKVHTDRIDQGFVLGNQVLVAEVFAKNGFLVLSSGTGQDKTADTTADQISRGGEYRQGCEQKGSVERCVLRARARHRRSPPDAAAASPTNAVRAPSCRRSRRNSAAA